MTADPTLTYSKFLFRLFIWGSDEKALKQKTPKCIMQWQKNMMLVAQSLERCTANSLVTRTSL